MHGTERATRHADAVRALTEHSRRADSAAIVETLTTGLELVGRLFLDRLRGGLNIGDSVIRADLARVPTLMECLRATLLVEAVESGVQVRRHHYLETDEDWYEKWLALALLGGELPLKQIVTGIGHYQKLSAENRQADLRISLERRVHEALDAPIVIYRLLTLAVKVITATAFHDAETAASARGLQRTLVPLCSQCSTCHGEILSPGKFCQACGNPFWRRDWIGGD